MTRGKWFLVWLLTVAVAFLGGFGWQYVRAYHLTETLQKTGRELVLQRMENQLAAATFEAQLGSYETARRLASQFYTTLQSSVISGPAVVDSAQFQLILQRRDATITLLSRADPGAARALADQYTSFRVAIGGPGAAFPAAGSAALPAPKVTADTTRRDTSRKDTTTRDTTIRGTTARDTTAVPRPPH